MASRKPSLKSRLLRHVMLPLVATWALGSGVMLAVSQHFAGQAFDRALLDDAYLVASRVAWRDGALRLDLSSTDMGTVLFDQSESEFFAVRRADGSLLAGHAGLQVNAVGDGGDIAFSEAAFQGRPVRSVTLRHAAPLAFSVTMAQTTASRRRLLQRALLYSIAPQMALLLLLAAWLRRVVHRDLQPLTALQQAVEQRDAGDLAPLGHALTDRAHSREVQRLADAINALLQRLEESVRAQREFAGNVAHELRTPLAGIRALAQYGLAHGDEVATLRAQLHAIVDSEDRASHLIDQLLAMALADEAQASLRLETMRLDTVVREVLLQHLPRADAAGVDLGAVGLETACEVKASGALLEGLLNNLIDNALRHGQPALPRRARVTVKLRRTPGVNELTVLDNGPGLAGTDPARWLHRGTQGSGPAQRLGQGAGLGLAIVARYAELMHARLVLDSGDGGVGLRVRVIFPAG